MKFQVTPLPSGYTTDVGGKALMNQREIERIRTVYAGRKGVKDKLYNPLDPGAFYLLTSRDRCMLKMLRIFLGSHQELQDMRILDIGCGDGNVLRRFVSLGARPENLCGIDLIEERIDRARAISPNIRFLIGDGGALPFEDATWDLVLLFTVISSILNPEAQRRVASEAIRVLKSGGAVLWYDFWLNPTNPDTKGISLSRIRDLFPHCKYVLQRTTLAPPLARRLARFSWPLCWMLESLPFLCTHYMGLIYKDRGKS